MSQRNAPAHQSPRRATNVIKKAIFQKHVLKSRLLDLPEPSVIVAGRQAISLVPAPRAIPLVAVAGVKTAVEEEEVIYRRLAIPAAV
ncbi:hypothetical protein M378DRAFT_9724 [Amanita muscaria Koide BX008]|uniref:Uncharacterized protein n=1 Tax=Amanita muscaria (strain Koide BX008) TaxID=946122 RepID=A0A0C2XE09_AMAMK|nr:hypothetical protein M378DRAFT_9724 [Amanita muscaria Koide BX008]